MSSPRDRPQLPPPSGSLLIAPPTWSPAKSPSSQFPSSASASPSFAETARTHPTRRACTPPYCRNPLAPPDLPPPRATCACELGDSALKVGPGARSRCFGVGPRGGRLPASGTGFDLRGLSAPEDRRRISGVDPGAMRPWGISDDTPAPTRRLASSGPLPGSSEGETLRRPRSPCAPGSPHCMHRAPSIHGPATGIGGTVASPVANREARAEGFRQSGKTQRRPP